MSQPNIKAVHTKIILCLQNKRADTQALVDSRATENFIHHQLITALSENLVMHHFEKKKVL